MIRIETITRQILNHNSGKIIFGNSASQLSYILSNGLLKNYRENDNIILSEFSHESMITPFEKLVDKKNIKYWKFERKIDYNDLFSLIDSSTRLIVIPHVSNILGNVLDIEYISKKVKSINNETHILVDGVAYIPHGIIDIDKYNIDYYIVSFYKFYGMRISAMAISDRAIIDVNNQNHLLFNSEKYNDSNYKLQIGGVNYETAISILGLEKYFIDIYKDYFNTESNIDIKFNRELFTVVMIIKKMQEKILVKRFINNLKDNDEIIIVEDTSNLLEKIPIFAIYFKNYSVENVNLILNNIGILSNVGKFYSDRLLNNYFKDSTKDILRFSLSSYNSKYEIDKITAILNMFTKKTSNFCYNKIESNINILTDKYEELQNSFNILDKDLYYKTDRYRGFSMINVININNIKNIGDAKFYQSSDLNNHNGGILRNYKNIQKNVLDNLYFKYYIELFIDKIRYEYKYTPKYLNVHQIRVIIDNNNNTVVPEGIHRDGFNMIMIVCISRENIKGGINEVYKDSNNILNSTQLNPSDAIIINDNKVLHNVTEINKLDINKKSWRDVFVFTTID
jgi:selenocysteine lyase/cysteine desulfurase